MKKILYIVVLLIISLFSGCTADKPGYMIVSQPVIIQGENGVGEYVTVLVDNDSRTIVTETIAQYFLHKGKVYSYSGTADVANGGSIELLIITPDSEMSTHFLFFIDSEAEASYQLYEDTTVSDNGADVTEINRNRLSDNLPLVQIFIGPNIINDGTPLSIQQWGSGKGVGGSHESAREWILDEDSLYLVRIINQTVSDNQISYEIHWYEH